MGIQIPASPDELIQTWADVLAPTRAGFVRVLVPTSLHERLVEVVEQMVPGGMCSSDDVQAGEPVSVESLIEIALLH